MKTRVLTPSPSTITSTASAAVGGGGGGKRSNRCYFPGCRKDSTCKCEICLASINATLDLIPSTSRPKITHSNLKKPQIKTSISIDSAAMMSFHNKVEREKRGVGFWGFLIRFILVLGFVLGVNLGFSRGINRVLKPDLFVEMEVSGCWSNGYSRKVNKNHLLVRSQCTLYKSVTKEVIICCWPLQTSTEEVTNFTINSNQSWLHQKCSASAVQFEENRWVVEYKQALRLENPRILSATFEFLKQEVWFLPDFGSLFNGCINEDNLRVPTCKQELMIENSRIISAALKFLKQEVWFLPDFGSLFTSGINRDNLAVS